MSRHLALNQGPAPLLTNGGVCRGVASGLTGLPVVDPPVPVTDGTAVEAVGRSRQSIFIRKTASHRLLLQRQPVQVAMRKRGSRLCINAILSFAAAA